MEYQDYYRNGNRYSHYNTPKDTNSYVGGQRTNNRFYHQPKYEQAEEVVNTPYDYSYRGYPTADDNTASYTSRGNNDDFPNQNRFGLSRDIALQFNNPTQPQQVPPRMFNGYPTYDVEVSPPFGKAYLPPRTENLMSTTISEGLTHDSFVVSTDTYVSYEPNDYNSIESFSVNQTFVPNDNSSFCETDIVGLGDKVYLFGIGFLIVIAVLLNGLEFAIFRTKPLRNYSFSVYLSALAVLDSFSLFGHIPRRWMNILYETLDWGLGVTVYDTNVIACRGLTYFSYISRFLSAWVVVALATERMIVSKDPYKKSKIRKPKTACQILMGLTILSLALNCHAIFTWGVVPKHDTTICGPLQDPPELSLFLTILSLLSIVALPFVCTLILTVLMLQHVKSKTWKLRPRKMSISAIKKLQFERKAVLMVSMITGVYAILSFPFTVSWVVLLVQHLAPPNNPCALMKTYAAKDITEVIYMANFAIKFGFCIFCGMNVVSHK